MTRIRLAATLMAVLLIPGLIFALEEAGALPLRPGALFPQPAQRGMDEVEALPVRIENCPACSHPTEIPEVDKLVRRPGSHDGGPLKWEMHAASRDADLCPHPGPNKVSFQADIVICPSCGFAAKAETFGQPVSREAAAWIIETLRPNLREAQYRLLGKRGAEMTEADVVAFFAHQAEIPDTVRTEHMRIFYAASGAPRLEQAEASWLAAWALRREIAAPSKGVFLSRRTDSVADALTKSKRRLQTVEDRIAALTYLLGKSGGRDRLPYADQLAAKLQRAGLQMRLGNHRKAEEELSALLLECRERFFRPQQDPLWSATNNRSSSDARMDELENMRNEIEREVTVRLEMIRGEYAHINRASELIREALLAGELDGKPESALFHAYLVAEFLRRTDNLPLAAEWFQNLITLAPADSACNKAARLQLQQVMNSADEHVNLLSALGQDGELFEKLRDICNTVHSVG